MYCSTSFHFCVTSARVDYTEEYMPCTPSKNMPPLLRVHNLCVSAPHHSQRIVRDVSFCMHRGEHIAVIGDSGSGKTTLLKAIAGVLPHAWHASGCVQVPHHELAYIMQEPKAALNPIRSIKAMFAALRHSRRFAGMSAKQTSERIRQRMHAAFNAMKLIDNAEADLAKNGSGFSDLHNLLAKRRTQVSGGMAQRIMVALAITAGSTVALADEVSSALDEKHERKTIETLLAAMQGVLFVTHRMNLVKDYCHKVLVLQNGAVHFFGDVAQWLREHGDDEHNAAGVMTGHASTQGRKKSHARAQNGSTARHGGLGGVVLRCERVGVYYDKPSFLPRATSGVRNFVLQGLNFSARAREVVLVRGETGCGKSTFAHVCAGQLQPCTGAVCMHNTPMPYGSARAMRIFRRDVQLISQVPSLSFNPLRTVLSSLMDAHATMSRAEKQRSQEYLQQLCKTMHISQAQLARFPHELSGGQLQRIAIIRALLPHPNILILDEPVSHLDPRIRIQVLERIAALHAQTRITLIVISHLEEVCAFIKRSYAQYTAYALEHGALVPLET